MWGKSKAKAKRGMTTQFDTLISTKTKIVGDLNFSGGLHIDGKVSGTIRAEGSDSAVLRISDVGEVDGDVYAPHIVINGTVTGDVHASAHVELAEKATIKGNVYYHLIEMAMGAEVNGNLMHQKTTVKTSPVAAAKADLADTQSLSSKPLGDGS